MSVRKLKPITPGQRFRVVNEFDTITTDKPEKSLLVPLKKYHRLQTKQIRRRRQSSFYRVRP